MKGIIVINKPTGISSNAVVAKVKHALGFKKIGYMGTLDPLAEGVLVLGVGKAARLFDFFMTFEKSYYATFEFGYETDTLDSEGEVTKKNDIIPTLGQLKNASKKLLGKISQLPPKYSAKSIDGVKAYERARRGEEFEVKPAEVEIYEIDFKNSKNPYEVFIRCSKGTYIRSIGRDLGLVTNSYAIMTKLVRMGCSGLTIDDAISIEELEKRKERAIISIDEVLKKLPKYELCHTLYADLSQGKKVKGESEHERFTLYCKNELFGIACLENGYIKILTYLKD